MKNIACLFLYAGLAQAQIPTITNGPASQVVWAGGTVNLSVGVSNAGAFTYQWQFNGTNLYEPTITTLVGGGVGDNRPATNASLNFPFAVTIDSSGNLFVADYNNNRIRKVDSNGVITAVAGMGTAGFSGDGGPAVNARLDLNDRNGFVVLRGGISFGPDGSLFIVDTGNQRVRRVDTNGIITTFAGNGSQGASGDGGPATNATFEFPGGVLADKYGNVFIADIQNGKIREVDTNGIITTIAGTGQRGYSNDGGPATNAALYFPTGLAMDAAGDLLVADTDNNRIRMIDTNGIITTVAGNGAYGYAGEGGLATNASLCQPIGVAVDLSGRILIADSGTNRVRAVDPATGIIKLLAGKGTNNFYGDGGFATNANLNYPTALTVDRTGKVYIADAKNYRIRFIDNAGIIRTFAGNGKAAYCGDYDYATNASLSGPINAVVDQFGDIFVADTGNSVVREVDTNGIITTVAGNGIYGYSGDHGSAINAKLMSPYAVAVDTAGNLYIADHDNNRIRKVDSSGVITTIAGTGVYGAQGDGGYATNATIAYPTGVTADSSGDVIFADYGGNRVREVYANGYISNLVSGLNIPYGVTLDPVGNLFIAEWNGQRIWKRSTNGTLTIVAGNGAFGYIGDGMAATNSRLQDPVAVAPDAIGNFYIADNLNYRIRQVDTNDIITTLTGTGVQGYSGDGGPAADAMITAPGGVAVDAAGNVYLTDPGNQRIRKVTFAEGSVLQLLNVQATNAGNYQVVITGSGGSITSSVANLTLTGVPLVTQAAMDASQNMNLHFVTRTNSINEVLTATNLTPPINWQPLSTNLAGPDGNWQYSDTNTAGYPIRFYRSFTQ